jgi:hypothetical protein
MKTHQPKFQKRWFGSYKIQYCLLNNIILLVTLDKFDPNPIYWSTLTNINLNNLLMITQ